MAETAPTKEEIKPQFNVSVSNGTPRIYTKEGPDGAKKRIGEAELLASMGHPNTLEERKYYEMGVNDAKVEAGKASTPTEEAVGAAAVEAVAESSPTTAPETTIAPEQQEAEVNNKKGVWNSLHDGAQEVTITGEGEPKEDGRATWRTLEHGDIPQDEVTILNNSPAAPAEQTADVQVVTPTAEAVVVDAEQNEQLTSYEKLHREAIDPERILELKDKYNVALNKELKLRGFDNDQARTRDPWSYESIKNQVKSLIVGEYLNLQQNDYDPSKIGEVRSDVMNMLELSEFALNNLALKNANETTPVTVVEPAPVVATEPVANEPVVEPGPVVAQPVGSEPFVPVAPDLPPDEETTYGWRDRARNWMMKPRLWIAGRNYDNEPEEEKRKRRYGIILGSLAALAAGIYLYKHMGNDGGVSDGVGFGGLGKNGHHQENFNQLHGHRIVQSVLPNNLEQGPVPGAGYEHIVDTNTHEEVVKHVGYAGNGRYSVDTIKDLKGDGYKVGTITTDINAPSGNGTVTHKVSVVTK